MEQEYPAPDFSGDDFADDKNILADREAFKVYEKMIDRSLSIIRQELDFEKASHKNFKDFHMYKSLGATLTASFRDADKVAWVSLAKYASSYPIGKYANRGVDQYLFGHITLPSRYPRTYIYKETLQEVIADLFLKREVDFDHSKSFSR